MTSTKPILALSRDWASLSNTSVDLNREVKNYVSELGHVGSVESRGGNWGNASSKCNVFFPGFSQLD